MKYIKMSLFIVVLMLAQLSAMAFISETEIFADDGVNGDYFGYSVSIDGDYAIVGAWADDSYKGSAYIFHRDDTNWTQQQKLTASDGALNDCFGVSVSISGDYAIVGADGMMTRKVPHISSTEMAQTGHNSRS